MESQDTKVYVLEMKKPNPDHGTLIRGRIGSFLRRHYPSHAPIEGGRKGPEFKFQMEEKYEAELRDSLDDLRLKHFRYNLKKA